MRKRVFGRRFKRTTKERKALFRSLMRSLVLYGRIKTTEAKAKAIRPDIEKAITLVKRRGEEARGYLMRDFSAEVLEKMIGEVAPHFKERAGGYTRILKTGRRLKDNAPMVIMEWVEETGTRGEEKTSPKGTESVVKKGEKKITVPRTRSTRKKKEEQDAKPHKTNKTK